MNYARRRGIIVAKPKAYKLWDDKKDIPELIKLLEKGYSVSYISQVMDRSELSIINKRTKLFKENRIMPKFIREQRKIMKEKELKEELPKIEIRQKKEITILAQEARLNGMSYGEYVAFMDGNFVKESFL